MPSKKKELPSASSAVLLTIDGWDNNWSRHKVMSKIETPALKELVASYPCVSLDISEIKNPVKAHRDLSERGYYALGTGTDMCSALTYVDRTIQDKTFFQNNILLGAIDHAKKNNSNLHLLGLASDAKKYSSLEHLKNLLKMARDNGLKDVYIHVILDGQDTTPNKGIEFIKRIKKYIQRFRVGKIATVHGSLYAMDRNNNWERVAQSYRALTGGKAGIGKDPEAIIKESYKKEIYDKEFLPTVITEQGERLGRIQKGDGLIFFNVKGDRSRELTKAFVMSSWDKIPDREYIKDLYFACFTEYEKYLPIKIAFPKIRTSSCLSEELDNKKWSHLKISGAEKYTHLNYFFNGERRTQFSCEERELVLSEEKKEDPVEEKIKNTEDIGERVIKYIKQNEYRFIVANLANFDLCKISAQDKKTKKKVVKYAEETDDLIKKITKAALNNNSTLLITSTSNIKTNRKKITSVPLVLVHKDLKKKSLDLDKNAIDNLRDLNQIILKILRIR